MAIKKTIFSRALYSHQQKMNQNRRFKNESTRGNLRRPKNCSIFIKSHKNNFSFTRLATAEQAANQRNVKKVEGYNLGH